MSRTITAFAPGRVNLIGDHTDHQGGLVLPMAVQRGTTVTGVRGGDVIELTSATEPGSVRIGLDGELLSGPAWARYAAAVTAALRPVRGFRGAVATTLPLGRGLSSSASLQTALALALGFSGTPNELAALCQRAEQAATGVQCGIMDQLAVAAGVPDRALLIDCHDASWELVPLPPDVDVLVVDSGERRSLADTAYEQRRRECAAAAEIVGPLRREPDVERIADPVLRRRARHVVTENQRVRAFAGALRAGDLHQAGALMLASHRSLRDDFESSTPTLDGLVAELARRPGIVGARVTGAGFGGCVVALAVRGTPPPAGAIVVRAATGACVSG